jgi:hypothetical protein
MTSRPVGIAIIILLACLCGIVPIVVSASLSLEFAALIVGLAIAVVAAVRIDLRRGGDLFSPLGLSGAFYLLAFVGGPIFFWFNPNFGQQSRVLLPFGHQALTVATALCLLGWIGFSIGYLLRPFSFLRIPALRLDGSPAISNTALIVLYALGWVARVGSITRGQYFHGSAAGIVAPTTGSTLNQVLFILHFLPSISVAYAGVMAATTHQRKWRRLYGAGLVVDVAYYLPSGSRSDVVTVALLALAVAYYARGRFPIRMLTISAVLLLFVLFPLIHLYRGSGGTSGFTTNTSGNLQQSAQTYTGAGLSRALLYGVGSTFSRFSDIFVPAALVEQGRAIYPVAPGHTLVWTLSSQIPHALWPSKPSVGNFSGEFAHAIGLVYSSSTSVSTTQIGEMYLNFGTIGVFVGMLFVGGVYRELGEWLRERKRNPMVLALYAALAYSILGSHETIVAGGLMGAIRTALVLSVILWIAMQVFTPPQRVSVAVAIG